MFSHTNHPRIVIIQPRFTKKHEKHLEGDDAKALDIQALIQEVLPKPPQLEPGAASALPKPSWSNLRRFYPSIPILDLNQWVKPPQSAAPVLSLKENVLHKNPKPEKHSKSFLNPALHACLIPTWKILISLYMT